MRRALLLSCLGLCLISAPSQVHAESERPLEGKNMGVELNPILPILAPFEDGLYFSGGISLFGLTRSAEIAFPFQYSASQTADYANSGYSGIDCIQFTQDLHYRYFWNRLQRGLYFSVFTRYAYLSGIESNYPEGSAPKIQADLDALQSSQHKWGMGLGIGYRFFTRSGWYWGCSLGYGRFLLGQDERFSPGSTNALDNDLANIFDMELLKVGLAF